MYMRIFDTIVRWKAARKAAQFKAQIPQKIQ
jgi:hypothetical protein